MAVATDIGKSESKLIPWTARLRNLPWWALILLLLGVLVVYFIFISPTYQDAFTFLVSGVRLTVLVSLVAFAVALIRGLILGMGRVSKNVVL